MFIRSFCRSAANLARNESIITENISILNYPNLSGIKKLNEALTELRGQEKDLVLVEVNNKVGHCLVVNKNERIRIPSKQASSEDVGFQFDPSRKKKIIRFSIFIEDDAFERKIEDIKSFLFSRHRCIIKILDGQSDKLILRISNHLNDRAEFIKSGNPNEFELWPR
jgi:translation initiation factor IF-3